MSNLFEVFGQGLAPTVSVRLGLDGRRRRPRGRTATHPQPARDEVEADLGAALERFQRRRWCEAAARFERVLSRADDCVPALLGLAACCDQRGRGAECIRWLDRAAAIEPRHAPLQLARGQCYERAAGFREARACYEAAMAADDQLVQPHLRLAAMHLAVGQYAGAAAHYRRVHEIAPEHAAHALVLAHLLLADGDVDEAIDYFERAITIEPDTWQASDDAAAALEDAGDLEKAIEYLEHALDTEPVFADTHLRVGDLYAKLGREKAALRHYLQAVEIHPDYLEAAVKVGTQHLRSGRYLESARWFNRGVAINDRLLAAYCGLAYAHLVAGHDDGLEAGLELAAAIEPNSTLLISEVARLQLRIHLMKHDPDVLGAAMQERDVAAIMDVLADRQIERLECLTAGRPNHAELHYNLGMLLRHRGRAREAIQRFNRSLEINPACVKAHLCLAIVHRELGNATGARHHLEAGFVVPQKDLPTFYSLALMAANPSQLRQAAVRFENGLDDRHGPVDFLANLDQALRTLGLGTRETAQSPFAAWELAPSSARAAVARLR